MTWLPIPSRYYHLTHYEVSIQHVHSFVLPRILTLKIYSVKNILQENTADDCKQDSILKEKYWFRLIFHINKQIYKTNKYTNNLSNKQTSYSFLAWKIAVLQILYIFFIYFDFPTNISPFYLRLLGNPIKSNGSL